MASSPLPSLSLAHHSGHDPPDLDLSIDSSSTLSVCSRSPSPPDYLPLHLAYPSPLSSDLSDLSSVSCISSPMPSRAASVDPASQSQPPMSQLTDAGSIATAESSQQEGERPSKRRRTSYEPKPRSTETLDLELDDVEATQSETVEKLLKVLRKRRKIVVVAGAGMSVSAGIPDFRSSQGLFKSLKKEHNLKSSGKDLFDASVYKGEDSTTSFHLMVQQLATATKGAQPTPFHHLLATLAAEGRLLRLYSQNVDGIDTGLEPLSTQVPLNRKAPWPKTIQLHGNLQKMVCSKCNHISELTPELFVGPTAPICEKCVAVDSVRTEYAGKRSHGIGRLRPRMVLYNEHNPDDEAIGAVVKADLRARPDALIVVGTTLKIPGVKRIVKEMCGVIRARRDGVTVWLSKEAPPVHKDYEWDFVVRGPCDRLAHLASLPHWDEQELPAVPEGYVPQTMAEVVVLSPSKQRVVDLLTPSASRPSSVPPSQPVPPQATGPKAGGAKKKQSKLVPDLKDNKKTERKKPAPKTASRAKKTAGPRKPKDPSENNKKIGFSQSKANIPAESKTRKGSANSIQPIAAADAENNPNLANPENQFTFVTDQPWIGDNSTTPTTPLKALDSSPPSRRNSDPRMDLNRVLNEGA